MTRSLKYQFFTNFRNLGVIFLMNLAFIPYTWLIISDKAMGFTMYYKTMCFGVLLLLSFILPFSNAGTLARLVLGYGATRRGWYLANIVTTISVQVIACALVLFISIPTGTFIFTLSAKEAFGEIRSGVSWLPVILALSLVLTSLAQAGGYIISRFTGKVLVVIIIISVSILIMALAFVFAFIGTEVITAWFTEKIVIILSIGVFAVFQIVSWFLLRNLPAA